MKRYFLKCTSCGAPAADNVRICPYCGKATGNDQMGIERKDDGGMHIGEGKSLHVGLDMQGKRVCPFCGATVAADARSCEYCKEKVVIESMRVATLTIQGGSLTVSSGGQVQVVGRRALPIHQAAARDDAEAVKAAVIDGDDPDHPDEGGLRPLHYAAQSGALRSATYLVSVGADVDIRSDTGKRAVDIARAKGHSDVEALLLMVGATPSH